jgi:hypothetical protein
MLLLDELTAEVSGEISINVGTTEEPIPLNIKFRPNSVTPALEDRVFAAARYSQIGNIYRLMLTESLVSWDIKGSLKPLDLPEDTESDDYAKAKKDNEKRTTPHILPVTEETISLVPVRILEKIVTAIQEAQTPSKKPSTTSRGSFGASSVAPFQPGTGS